MKLTRKEVADLIGQMRGDPISTDVVRKNEVAWGLDRARLPDLNKRTVRYDAMRVIRAMAKRKLVTAATASTAASRFC